MKTIFTILFVIMTVLCHGQKNNYNDWFDMNLKVKPVSIKEVSIFSLTDFLKPNLKMYLNSTLNQMFFVDEFHFDSNGLISKEYHKNILDTTGRWQDYKTRRLTQYKDSILVTDFYKNSREKSLNEKRYLDEKGFLRRMIRTIPETDTIINERDQNNRIIKSYTSIQGTDTFSIIKIENEYNENGDIKIEKRWTRRSGPMYNKPSIEEVKTFFNYIYDSFNNWIVKVSIIHNEVSIITQRSIKY